MGASFVFDRGGRHVHGMLRADIYLSGHETPASGLGELCMISPWKWRFSSDMPIRLDQHRHFRSSIHASRRIGVEDRNA